MEEIEMAQVKVIPLAVPRKKRCPACDRFMAVQHKILLVKSEELLGDFELCPECSSVIAELIGKGTEKIIAEWCLGGE
jgi:ribosomal protein S27AE